jgi:hypothetical protein
MPDPTSEDLDKARNHGVLLVTVRPSDSTKLVAAITGTLALQRGEPFPGRVVGQ